MGIQRQGSRGLDWITVISTTGGTKRSAINILQTKMRWSWLRFCWHTWTQQSSAAVAAAFVVTAFVIAAAVDSDVSAAAGISAAASRAGNRLDLEAETGQGSSVWLPLLAVEYFIVQRLELFCKKKNGLIKFCLKHTYSCIGT